MNKEWIAQRFRLRAREGLPIRRGHASVPTGTSTRFSWIILHSQPNGQRPVPPEPQEAPTPIPGSFRNERGVTYLAALSFVVVMGIGLTVVGKNWTFQRQREQEAELIFRALRIKEAIERYAADYEVRKGTRENQYPLRLEQLVEGPKRYLPRVYADPMTGDSFELIREDGQIHGIKSRSQARPINRVIFKEAATYRHIEFRAVTPSPNGPPCGSGIVILTPLNPSRRAEPACEEPQGGQAGQGGEVPARDPPGYPPVPGTEGDGGAAGTTAGLAPSPGGTGAP